MPDVDQVLADLEFIETHWHDLLEARMPGTSRPWRQALLDPADRAKQAARDRDERAHRDPDRPGFTSAPQHLDVLDVIVDTWMLLDELAAALHRVTVDTQPPAAAIRHFTDTSDLGPFIRRTVHALDEADPRAHRAARKLSSTVTEITRVLGLVRAGQLLAGATCPWCRGVTPKHPAGGATTMRVEEVGGSKELGVEPVPAVVCWNPLCTPPDTDCGTWHRGRPAWPWHEWDWLAKRLITADPPAVLAPPAAPRPAGFSRDPIPPADHSGRTGYRYGSAAS